MSNKIFSKVPIEVPNRSGFHMGHENLFTAAIGTLVPCLVDELLPNDTVSLGTSMQIQLPPMASDFYGRVRGKVEIFFVPFRLLYGGWQELITHPVTGDVYPSSTGSAQKAKFLPYLEIPNTYFVAGSLADYLGFKFGSQSGIQSLTYKIDNPLSFIAYHKIWDDWYRDSRIQKSCFERYFGSNGNYIGASNLPYVTDYSSSPKQMTSAALADNVFCYALRQRNYAKDYFTNATPLPQAGQPSALGFSVDLQTGNGSFSIAALRAANSLQQWMERNNIAGYRYSDQIKAQFGITPSDAVLDRSLYLGSMSVDIYNKSVFMNTNDSTSTNNPFQTAGSKYGSPLGVGDGGLVDEFTATEHGFLFGMFSIVPDALYSTGTRRYLSRSSSADFAFPLLSGVGDQPIYQFELALDRQNGSLDKTAIFAYTQRYSEYKFMLDEVHGLLWDSGSLSSFALKRGFSTAPTSPSSSFLEIPKTALDEVSAVSSSKTSNFGAWVDMYFDYRKVSTLPAYSIPTLGDLKNTHTELIDAGGKRL